jgi:hypothetical protein
LAIIQYVCLVCLPLNWALADMSVSWGAKQDGRDIEFALGSSPREARTPVTAEEVKKLAPFSYTGPKSRNLDGFFHQSTQLWVLDFNQVQPITLDDEGVALAVEAVRLNDPYFSKPLRESAIERAVWKTFVLSYLHVSQFVLKRGTGVEEDVLALPHKFILGVIDLERTKVSRA